MTSPAVQCAGRIVEVPVTVAPLPPLPVQVECRLFTSEFRGIPHHVRKHQHYVMGREIPCAVAIYRYDMCRWCLNGIDVTREDEITEIYAEIMYM